MKALTFIAAAVIGLGFVGTAHADRWDSSGWVKLGEREVNGRYDHDKIDVGAYEGKFAKLTLYVERSEMELLDFEITFGNGERFHPEVHHFFREGTRTRVIDLPGDTRVIRNINLRYKNVGHDGVPAKVEVWGLKVVEHGGGGPGWDNHGWQMLGERMVNGHGREDHDRIEVGGYKGRFNKLTIAVSDSDLEMIDFEVKFANGQAWHPGMSYFFKEGTRTRVLDLPGDDRVIRFVDFKYRNIPGEGHARVQVWAK